MTIGAVLLNTIQDQDIRLAKGTYFTENDLREISRSPRALRNNLNSYGVFSKGKRWTYPLMIIYLKDAKRTLYTFNDIRKPDEVAGRKIISRGSFCYFYSKPMTPREIIEQQKERFWEEGYDFGNLPDDIPEEWTYRKPKFPENSIIPIRERPKHIILDVLEEYGIIYDPATGVKEVTVEGLDFLRRKPEYLLVLEEYEEAQRKKILDNSMKRMKRFNDTVMLKI